MLRQPWGEEKGSEVDDEEDSSYHLMALEDKRVIGVARLQFFDDENSAQLRYMAVDTDFQGRGVGRKIVEHMEDYAKQQSATQLFLHARENAVGFYLNMGYAIEESSYLLFGSIQHFKMSKQL